MVTRSQNQALGSRRHPFDELFDAFFTRPNAAQALWGAKPQMFPALNVWEDQDHLHVEAELPGVKLENVEVTIHDGHLWLKGRQGEEVEGRKYHHRERAASAFQRSMQLPYEVDADRVEARFVDGVLTVSLPKAEAAKPRKIEVKTQ